MWSQLRLWKLWIAGSWFYFQNKCLVLILWPYLYKTEEQRHKKAKLKELTRKKIETGQFIFFTQTNLKARYNQGKHADHYILQNILSH